MKRGPEMSGSEQRGRCVEAVLQILVISCQTTCGCLATNYQSRRLFAQIVPAPHMPDALCYLQCPMSAALASCFRMDSISTSYTVLLAQLPPYFAAKWREPSHVQFELGGKIDEENVLRALMQPRPDRQRTARDLCCFRASVGLE